MEAKVKHLAELAPDTRARIVRIDGSVRLLTRLASIGLVPGSSVQVVRNDARRPVLVHERDTMVAINRQEAVFRQSHMACTRIAPSTVNRWRISARALSSA